MRVNPRNGSKKRLKGALEGRNVRWLVLTIHEPFLETHTGVYTAPNSKFYYFLRDRKYAERVRDYQTKQGYTVTLEEEERH